MHNLTINNKKGSVTSVVLAVLAIVLIGGGALSFSYVTKQKADQRKQEIEANLEAMEEGSSLSENREAMEAPKGERDQLVSSDFTGKVLAGTSAPLIEFDQADYEKVRNQKKLVVLYFYANWCPICKKEFPLMQSAFDSLETDDVVGFRVNFNDNETTPEEEALAREFGVAYQHTKVFLLNGERVLKSPESWDEARYFSEIKSQIN